MTEEEDPIFSTTIDDLPIEILAPIIDSLPYQDRLTVTAVSTRWHGIIDEMLGRKLFIGKSCQFTPDDEERYRHHYVPLEAIQKVGVNSCYFGEVVDPIKSMSSVAYYLMKLRESIFGPRTLTFKHPHLVKNIFFDGPIPPKYFDAIIQPVTSLERLDLHLSSFSCLTPTNMNLSKLIRLETLNIWGHKLTQGLFTAFYSPRLIVDNLIALWNQSWFSNLKNLAMEYPYDLRDEPTVTDTLLEFLKNHKETLEKLKLCINLFLTAEPTEFENPQDFAWIQKTKSISKKLNLKHIEIIITSLYKVLLLRIWIGFVESQRNLESITVATFKLDTSILYRICEQNFKTITKIGLTRLNFTENGRFVPISCSIFKNCKLLTTLFLEGMTTGDLGPGLYDIQELPQSIRQIDMGGITLSSEDTHFIFTQLINLEDIFLTSAGHSGEFGVTINTIVEIIRIKRIKKISLYGCVNGQFPTEGISNGNPDSPKMVTARPFGMLEMMLGEDGYYKNIPRAPLFETVVNFDMEDLMD